MLLFSLTSSVKIFFGFILYTNVVKINFTIIVFFKKRLLYIHLGEEDFYEMLTFPLLTGCYRNVFKQHVTVLALSLYGLC